MLARAASYVAVFVTLLLVYTPAWLLAQSGIAAPRELGVTQAAGMVVTAAGALLALSCALTFVFVGRGTPAPFDPPRRLVVRGPYRVVRNPMYAGAVTALLGAALYFESLALAGYAGVCFLAAHALVLTYEEPTLRTTFGPDYVAHCERVGRWWPKRQVG
ncbi:MAG: methyltransferase family protein [Acidobacteriota bacterium]